MTQRPCASAYPADLARHGCAGGAAAFLWPARFGRRRALSACSLPAVLLVGLLVLGLVADRRYQPARRSTPSTFRLSEDYTLANYWKALTEPLFRTSSRGAACSAR